DEKALAMAEYWLRDIESFGGSRGGTAIASLRARIAGIASGLAAVEEARALAAREKLLEARAKLDEAIARGVSRDSIALDVADVTTRCEARASALASASRLLLDEKKLVEAARRAKEARRYAPSSAEVTLLVAEIDARLGAEARREAAALALE